MNKLFKDVEIKSRFEDVFRIMQHGDVVYVERRNETRYTSITVKYGLFRIADAFLSKRSEYSFVPWFVISNELSSKPELWDMAYQQWYLRDFFRRREDGNNIYRQASFKNKKEAVKLIKDKIGEQAEILTPKPQQI